MSSAKLDSHISAANGATGVGVKQNSAIAAERNGRTATAETTTSLDFKHVLIEA